MTGIIELLHNAAKAEQYRVEVERLTECARVHFEERKHLHAEIERLQDTIKFANKVMDAKDAEIERLTRERDEGVSK
jgi:hypothetical protein